MTADIRPFWPVAVLAAYDSIGYELLGPVLPAVKERAGATPLEASLIFAAFSVGMLAGFAVGGAAIRRTGPRGAALTGVALHLAADLLFIGGHSPRVYLGARLLQGFGSGELWMASTFCVLSRWPDRSGLWLGRMLTAYAAGSVVGPLLAGLGGAVRPFAGDAVLSATGFLAAAAMPARHGRTFDWGLGVLRDRRLAFGALASLLTALILTTIEGSYTLAFARRLSRPGAHAPRRIAPLRPRRPVDPCASPCRTPCLPCPPLPHLKRAEVPVAEARVDWVSHLRRLEASGPAAALAPVGKS